ncbi:MAG: hypothetical protein JNL79_40680 [Myxococcales bacterium]|nr:hypothetical protein [Myxococcales bacterium]
MRALIMLLIASSFGLVACAGPGSRALSASLVDDVLEAEGHAVEMFAAQVEQRVEAPDVAVEAPKKVVVGGTSVSNGKGGPQVKVGGIQVGNGKVVVPGVATVVGP